MMEPIQIINAKTGKPVKRVPHGGYSLEKAEFMRNMRDRDKVPFQFPVLTREEELAIIELNEELMFGNRKQNKFIREMQKRFIHYDISEIGEAIHQCYS